MCRTLLLVYKCNCRRPKRLSTCRGTMSKQNMQIFGRLRLTAMCSGEPTIALHLPNICGSCSVAFFQALRDEEQRNAEVAVRELEMEFAAMTLNGRSVQDADTVAAGLEAARRVLDEMVRSAFSFRVELERHFPCPWLGAQGLFKPERKEGVDGVSPLRWEIMAEDLSSRMDQGEEGEDLSVDEALVSTSDAPWEPPAEEGQQETNLLGISFDDQDNVDTTAEPDSHYDEDQIPADASGWSSRYSSHEEDPTMSNIQASSTSPADEISTGTATIRPSQLVTIASRPATPPELRIRTPDRLVFADPVVTQHLASSLRFPTSLLPPPERIGALPFERPDWSTTGSSGNSSSSTSTRQESDAAAAAAAAAAAPAAVMRAPAPASCAPTRPPRIPRRPLPAHNKGISTTQSEVILRRDSGCALENAVSLQRLGRGYLDVGYWNWTQGTMEAWYGAAE